MELTPEAIKAYINFQILKAEIDPNPIIRTNLADAVIELARSTV